MAGCKSYLDLLYLGFIGPQVMGMFFLEFLPFYPKFLWKEPSAPLHFMSQVRQLYIDLSGDPLIGRPQDYIWFEAAAYIELIFQCPLGIYLVYKLFTKRPADGTTELAALAFACMTGYGSALCAFELLKMSPQALGPGQRIRLLAGEYVPYTVVSIIMAVDMYTRLLKRVSEPAKAKSQ